MPPFGFGRANKGRKIARKRTSSERGRKPHLGGCVPAERGAGAALAPCPHVPLRAAGRLPRRAGNGHKAGWSRLCGAADKACGKLKCDGYAVFLFWKSVPLFSRLFVNVSNS